MSRTAARAELRILRHTGRILTWLETELSFPKSLIVALACIFSAWSLTALGGAVFVNNYVLDFGFAIGEVWRLQQGHIPYLDWRTPLGPLYYALLAAASGFAPSLPEAVVWAGFLGATLLIAPVLYLLRTGLPGGAALALALALWLIAVGPRNPDGLLEDASWLALYNGLCLPLLAAVLVCSLFPTARPLPSCRQKTILFLIFSSALALCTTALILLKAPHGLLALISIIAGLFLRSDRRHLLIMGGAITLISIFTLQTLFPEATRAHLTQLAEIARASDIEVRFSMKKEIFFGIGSVLLTSHFISIWLLEQYRKEDTTLWPDVGAILVAVALTWTAAFQDHPATPVLAILPPLLAWRSASAHRLPISGFAGKIYRGNKTTFLLLVPGLILAWWTANGIVSLPLASLQARLTPPTWGPTLPHAHAWRLPREPSQPQHPSAEMTPAEWQATLVAAVELLRLEGLSHRRILVLDFANPIPWLLQSPPPRGTLAWMDPDRTLPTHGYLTVEDLVGDAEVLLSPKRPSHPRVLSVIAHLQGKNLIEQFPVVVETDLWRVRLRKNIPTPPQ